VTAPITLSTGTTLKYKTNQDTLYLSLIIFQPSFPQHNQLMVILQAYTEVQLSSPLFWDVVLHPWVNGAQSIETAQ
jgi:hypothetical protein